jgi:alkaline phosphatase D
MPIREPGRGRNVEMADRTFRFADVATLHMVETRLLARSKPLSYATDLSFSGGRPDLAGFEAKLKAADRNLLGGTQLASLSASVGASVKAGVTWQVLGNQIVMGRVRGPNVAAQLTAEQLAGVLAGLPADYRPRVEQALRLFALDVPYNLDAWDGYPAERERLYGMLKAAGAHPIVLAGDSHAFWVNALKDATGASIAAEFGTTSVTSPGFSDVVKGIDLGAAFAARNERCSSRTRARRGSPCSRSARRRRAPS